MLLLVVVQFLERTGEMATRPEHGRATSSVVPVEGRTEGNVITLGESEQQLLNQQPVVDYDQLRSPRHVELLISKIWIVNRRDPSRVSISQHSPQFLARHVYPAGYDQGGVPEVDESDLPTCLDAPAVA